jgi:hypothetical protein
VFNQDIFNVTTSEVDVNRAVIAMEKFFNCTIDVLRCFL